MKILLLSAYLISSAFFQQDNSFSKKADKTNPPHQKEKSQSQNTELSATHKQQTGKGQRAKEANAPSPFNATKSTTPKN